VVADSVLHRYCELALMLIRRAKDPEAERLGLSSDLLKTAKEMLTSSIEADRHHQAFAFKTRSRLQTDPQLAADDLWEAARVLSALEKGTSPEWKESVDTALRAARKAYKKLNQQKVCLFLFLSLSS
jgi:hypothetical protein